MLMDLHLSFKVFDFILNDVVTFANFKSEKKLSFHYKKHMFS